jgi:hypothetical protein
MDSQTPANIRTELESARLLLAEAIKNNDSTRRQELKAEVARLRDAEAATETADAAKATVAASVAASVPSRAAWEPTPEQGREALAKLGYTETDDTETDYTEAAPWIRRPFLRREGLTKIVAPPDGLPDVSDFIAGLAAEFEGDIVLCTKSPAAFTTKFIDSGGDRKKLLAFPNLDFSDAVSEYLHRALFELRLKAGRGYSATLFAFPNLIEFVPKPLSQTHSEKVLRELKAMTLDDYAVVFGWPSSQRKSATGCATWTNAGDVHLTLADIRPPRALSEEERRPLTPREKALWFIAGALSFGPRPLKEILQQAKARGIKDTTFYAAGREIVNATRSKQACGESTWKLRESRMNTGFFAGSSHFDASGGDI